MRKWKKWHVILIAGIFGGVLQIVNLALGINMDWRMWVRDGYIVICCCVLGIIIGMALSNEIRKS